MSAPIEAKVKTSALAALASTLVLSLLAQYVFTSGPVPEFVVAFVESAALSMVGGAVTFAVGWLTRHTPRDVIDVAENRDM
jgi:hypothetical protein